MRILVDVDGVVPEHIQVVAHVIHSILADGQSELSDRQAAIKVCTNSTARVL